MLAYELTNWAEENGIILTIERQPRKPLAMGNHEALARTWPVLVQPK